MTAQNLEELRHEIDALDTQLVQLLAKRQACVMQAARFKKDTQGVKDHVRVEAVIQKVREKAITYEVNPDLVEHLYREMIGSFITMELAEFSEQKDT